MDNLKKDLESGAKLEVTLAPFKDGHKLLKVVMRELGTIRLSLGLSAKDVEKVLQQDVNEDVLNTLKNLMSTIVGSDEVEKALWPCMERATYNGRKVNADLFEDGVVRADFLVVAREVLLFNLRPFTQSLLSLFSKLRQEITSSQKPA